MIFRFVVNFINCCAFYVAVILLLGFWWMILRFRAICWFDDVVSVDCVCVLLLCGFV